MVTNDTKGTGEVNNDISIFEDLRNCRSNSMIRYCHMLE
jgi:hypothetical protein